MRRPAVPGWSTWTVGGHAPMDHVDRVMRSVVEGAPIRNENRQTFI
jgi:hypothetical protein